MRLRQEQIVFVLCVVVLGLMAWSQLGDPPTIRGGSGRGEALEPERFDVPDAARVLPEGEAAEALLLERDLFTRPRDTHPLPKLELAVPPLEPLPMLLPPTDPGPAPRHYGEWLRTPAETVEVAGLFDSPDLEDDLFFEGDDVVTGGSSARDDLRAATGVLDDETRGLETPAEREARMAAYRRQYDWIQRGPRDVIFGRITNEGRFGLKVDASRSEEAIDFVQVDPDTGKETYASVGAPAISYERERVAGFGFAETPANQLELRRLAIETPLTLAGYAEAMRLANDAVRLRYEAPRALEIARELYALCAAFEPDNADPRLGLAACHEVAFDFDRAAREYEAVIAAFPHRLEAQVRLAGLEERFLLREAAEERLRAALRQDSSSWVTRWGLGRFLLRDGRTAEAVAHLEVASRNAPQEPEQLAVRVAIRTDYASALFAEGQVAEAARVFDQALTADRGHQRARAGAIAARLLAGSDGDAAATSVVDSVATDGGAGFELSLVLGIVAAVEGRFTEARDLLFAAERADPLRSSHALAALSFLAERTGHPDQALAFADEALARDPEAAWSSFQRGRLLAAQADYEGALESLTAALEAEADFEDALVALGDVAFRLGRFEEAERYLARALSVGEPRPDVLALRGVNFLRLGSTIDARAAFEGALELVPGHDAGRAGVAWCTYLEDDSREAKVLLADLDEARRAQPEDDPWRVWARDQIDRISEHEGKVEWVDAFNRKRLMNGWVTRESVGPLVAMENGAVSIQGVFEKAGATQVFREYPASQFVSIDADLWVEASSNTRVGLFIARERQRRDAADVIGEVSVSRHKEGGLQVRFVEQGNSPDVTDMQQPFPTGEWVRLRIERFGAGSEASVTVSMNGIPLLERVPFASLGRAASPLLVGVAVEGEAGRSVDARLDNVAVVYRK